MWALKSGSPGLRGGILIQALGWDSWASGPEADPSLGCLPCGREFFQAF